METLDLVILAAGNGTRAHEPLAKQFLDLNGKPVIIHSLSKFENLPFVGTKYVTTRPEDRDYLNGLLSEHGITNVELVCGGDTRQESVRLALEHVRSNRVITHNAALPFVTRELIENVVHEDYPCVTTVTPLAYNLCRGDQFAVEMVPSAGLKLINTPQSFHTEAFRQCHRRAYEEQLSVKSDCELMLHYGYPVRFVEGSLENFKITTPLDVVLARALAEGRLKTED